MNARIRFAQIVTILAIFSIPLSTTVTSILFPLSALCSVIAGQWRQRFLPLFQNNRVAQSLLLLFALFVFAGSYSIASSKEVIHDIVKHTWLLSAVLIMPLFTDARWQRLAINALLAAMLVVLLLSTAKYCFSLDWHFNASDRSAVFKDYIQQSLLMSITCCLCYYRAQQSTGSWRLLWAVYCLGAMLNVTLMSQGRTGYVVFFALMSFIALNQLRPRNAILLVTTALFTFAAAGFWLNTPLKQRLAQAVTDVQRYQQQGELYTSLGIRIAEQTTAIKLIQQKPIFGYGTGTLKKIYNESPLSPYRGANFAHETTNLFLNTAVQFGLVGLAVLLLALSIQARAATQLLGECRFLINCLLLSIVVGGLVNSWLTDFTPAHLYGSMMAVCFAATTRKRHEQSLDDKTAYALSN